MKDEDKAELAQFMQKEHCSFEGTDACDECQRQGFKWKSERKSIMDITTTIMADSLSKNL